MIVIDASALVAFIMMEEDYERIGNYLEESVSIDHIIKEVGNAIWKTHIRGYITKEDVFRRFKNLVKLVNVIELINEINLINDAMNIAIESKITLYDASYSLSFKKKNSITYIR